MASLDIQRDVPLAPLTTLELGGAAKYFVRARSAPAVIEALRWAADRGRPAAILGGGSNLLVPDAGYEGLVVHMAIEDLDFREGGIVEAGAGVPWERVVEGAVSRGWGGVECLTGIPGSTGATPIQNVGAYGQEVAEVIERVHAVRRDTLEAVELSPEACGFAYRDSLFKREPNRYVVTAVDFALWPDGSPTVRYAELERAVGAGPTLDDVRSTVLRLRRKKSMVIDSGDPNRRSAGSFFLNPIVSSAEGLNVESSLNQPENVMSPVICISGELAISTMSLLPSK